MKTHKLLFFILIVVIIFCIYYLYKNITYENFNIIEENSNTYNSLNESQLVKTTHFNTPNFRDFHKISTVDISVKYILVIDMPNYGGGTTFFMNTVVSMFKNKVSFLIARNFNNRIHFYINDESKLDQIMEDYEGIEFLNTIQDNISKIFVNHTAGHSDKFLKHLFTLNKNVTTITHDYSVLFEKTQPLYPEIKNSKLNRSVIDIRNYDQIITQNTANLEIFKKYIGDQSVYVSPLPDYHKTHIKITSQNKKTVIGVIGNISDIKGAKYVKELIEWSLQNADKYTVVVFGSINMDYKLKFSYNTINELNSLLTKYKPNVLIEASLWPETYSYTLSLSMITSLPIMFLSKSFPSVIENRLSKYSNAYKYDNVRQMCLDFDSKKQDFFYTIEPKIYFNSFWGEYFLS